MGQAVKPEEAERRYKALQEGIPRGESFSQIAESLGLAKSTLKDWAYANGFVLPTKPVAVTRPPIERHEPPPAPAPREIRDAAFYRKQSVDLRRQLDEAQHLVEELAGVRQVAVTPPEWMQPEPPRHGRAVLIAHTSDLHMGEVIAPGEIEGLNGYDPEIARARMRRYFETVCTIGPRWMESDECDGVLLTMGGDLISGDIHDELTRTNALTSHEQVRAVIEVYEAGIRMLADRFGKVHVVAVPGNHGRTTTKPTAKLAARLSYDIQAADMLRDRMRDDARVTWSIATGPDVRVPLYGRTILVTHGDRIGTGGGQGFAGPVLPIIRGGHNVRRQAASAGLLVDLLLMGHYHTSAAPPGILANGSVVGYGEFGNSIRASVEPPKQWLARFSHRYGLCETLAVQLTDGAGKMKIKGAA